MLKENKPTVLLTGATGFLGSHLLRRLHHSGYSTIALKRSISNTYRINDILSDITTYDIDKMPLRFVFERESIDVVIHAATCYGRKGESVSDIVKANVVFPLALLELGVEFGIETFLNTGTVLPSKLNYYALTKHHFQDYASRIAKESDVRFINVLPEHMYGPDDDPSRFIPFLIQSFLSNNASIDLTAGEQRRDFIYVDDVVEAYVTLLEQQASIDKPLVSFEIGTGESLLLSDVVKLVHKLCESSTELHFGAIPYREGEIMNSQTDIMLLQRLGWSSKLSLCEGLARTIQAEEHENTI